MTKGQVVKALMRQFDVNDVESFDTPTLVKTVKVGKKKGSRNKIVLLEFEIRSPLFSNLDVIMNYSKSVELEPKAGD